MKPGKYHVGSYTVTISSSTKESELKWLFDLYPEFKKLVCDNTKKKSKLKGSSKSKQADSAK
jgi:hypothetical protein